MNLQFISTILARFVTVSFSQEEKGIRKYGKELDPLDNYDWLQMAEEELVDGFKYLQCAKVQRDMLQQRLDTMTRTATAAGDRIRELETEMSELRAAHDRRLWQRLAK